VCINIHCCWQLFSTIQSRYRYAAPCLFSGTGWGAVACTGRNGRSVEPNSKMEKRVITGCNNGSLNHECMQQTGPCCQHVCLQNFASVAYTMLEGDRSFWLCIFLGRIGGFVWFRVAGLWGCVRLYCRSGLAERCNRSSWWCRCTLRMKVDALMLHSECYSWAAAQTCAFRSVHAKNGLSHWRALLHGEV
jgi:hypothetical protein